METETDDLQVNIDYYRKMVQHYMNLHLYGAALFWADKVVALSKNEPNDVYWMAQCMYQLKQYTRAAHLVKIKGLDKTHTLCHYIGVKSLFEAGDLNEALQLLESVDLTRTKMTEPNKSLTFLEPSKNQVEAAICLLKGRVFEAMDNREMATDCYKQALTLDVHCYEAFEALIKYQMLTSEEEQFLLNSLPLMEQCGPSESQILHTLYSSKLRKYHAPVNINENESLMYQTAFSHFEQEYSNLTVDNVKGLPNNHSIKPKCHNKKGHEAIKEPVTVMERLYLSLDMVVSLAEKYYYNCQYSNCIRITENILKTDPYHSSCLPIHIACLVDLKQSNKLFFLAHKLVALYPEFAISWFAVGCYYYVIGKSDPARRFLSKATNLDRLFGPAWLAYGHSFAIENEHDQAMAAYFKASQLMKGCHLPLLYIGLECGLTNNERLAEKFFQQAKLIAPEDPFVMHEMGIIAFQNGDYNLAERHFRDALKKILSIDDGANLPEKWEPLLNNLGHTCRKLQKYHEALQFHKEALNISPQNPATYSALGYVQALLGRKLEAVESFHKALGLRKNDTFSITMLRLVVDELFEENSPFPDSPDSIPPFELPSVKKLVLSPTITGNNDISRENDTSIVQSSTTANRTILSDVNMSFD